MNRSASVIAGEREEPLRRAAVVFAGDAAGGARPRLLLSGVDNRDSSSLQGHLARGIVNNRASVVAREWQRTKP
jgi:hypothetical protein